MVAGARRGLLGGHRQAVGSAHVGVDAEVDVAACHLNHARQAHHPAPGALGSLHRGGHAQPGDDGAAPPGVERTLRRVEIEAVVEELVAAGKRHAAGVLVEVREHADGHVGGRRAVVEQAHGGDHEDAGTVDLEPVGALPHPAETVALDRAGELPGTKVVAAVDEKAPLAVDRRAEHEVVAVAPAPDLRVARMGGVAQLRIGDRRDDDALGVQVVEVPPVGGDELHLAGFEPVVQVFVDVLRVGLEVADAGVEEVQAPRALYGAAGEAAVSVGELRGEEGDSLVLPVDEVGRHRVPPVHGSPARGIGEVLIEQVVLPAVVDEPIGVVDPVERRLEVARLLDAAHVVLLYSDGWRGQSDMEVAPYR